MDAPCVLGGERLRLPSFAALGAWLWRGEGPLVLGDLSVQPADLHAFHIDGRDATARKLRLVIYLLLGFNLGFWLTDDWLLGHLPYVQPALTEGRVAATACGLLALALTLVPDRLRPLAGWFGAAATCGVIAWTVGRIGGPDSVWFFYTFPFLFLGLAAWLPPAHRLLGTALLCATTAALFFGPHPAHRADPVAGSALANLVCIALLAAAIGVYLDYFRLRVFLMGREREHLVADLGAQVAAQTRHIQRLLDHVETAREAERGELAAELHDEMGQLLTAMRCVVKSHQLRGAGGPDLDQLAQLLQQSTRALRDVLERLRPRVLDDLGLGPATEWMVHRVAGLGGLDFALDLPAHGALDTLTAREATVAFRVVQESLTNVLRHAQATRVDVQVELDAGQLTVRVEDDGIGIEPGLDSQGFGLLSMAERAHTLGGQVVVAPRPRGGTRVSLTLPTPAALGLS